MVVHGGWFKLLAFFYGALMIVFVNHNITNGELVLRPHPQSLDEEDIHVLQMLNIQKSSPQNGKIFNLLCFYSVD